VTSLRCLRSEKGNYCSQTIEDRAQSLFWGVYAVLKKIGAPERPRQSASGTKQAKPGGSKGKGKGKGKGKDKGKMQHPVPAHGTALSNIASTSTSSTPVLSAKPIHSFEPDLRNDFGRPDFIVASGVYGPSYGAPHAPVMTPPPPPPPAWTPDALQPTPSDAGTSGAWTQSSPGGFIPAGHAYGYHLQSMNTVSTGPFYNTGTAIHGPAVSSPNYNLRTPSLPPVPTGPSFSAGTHHTFHHSDIPPMESSSGFAPSSLAPVPTPLPHPSWTPGPIRAAVTALDFNLQLYYAGSVSYVLAQEPHALQNLQATAYGPVPPAEAAYDYNALSYAGRHAFAQEPHSAQNTQSTALSGPYSTSTMPIMPSYQVASMPSHGHARSCSLPNVPPSYPFVPDLSTPTSNPAFTMASGIHGSSETKSRYYLTGSATTALPALDAPHAATFIGQTLCSEPGSSLAVPALASSTFAEELQLPEDGFAPHPPAAGGQFAGPGLALTAAAYEDGGSDDIYFYSYSEEGTTPSSSAITSTPPRTPVEEPTVCRAPLPFTALSAEYDEDLADDFYACEGIRKKRKLSRDLPCEQLPAPGSNSHVLSTEPALGLQEVAMPVASYDVLYELHGDHSAAATLAEICADVPALSVDTTGTTYTLEGAPSETADPEWNPEWNEWFVDS
jgi:hypothetical protein